MEGGAAGGGEDGGGGNGWSFSLSPGQRNTGYLEVNLLAEVGLEWKRSGGRGPEAQTASV